MKEKKKKPRHGFTILERKLEETLKERQLLEQDG